jgi:glycosyltransferase involved in cell wall biosynthesis
VFCPYPRGRLCDELDKIGIQYTLSRFKYSNTIYPHTKNIFKYVKRLTVTIFQLLFARIDFAILVRRFRPDIVHCNVGPLNISSGICLRKHIPHVWHLREYQDLDFDMHYIPSKSYFKKQIFMKGNFNIAITKGVFDYWNLRNNKDVAIYDGVFSDKVIKLLDKNERKDDYFLFVGRVVEAKGLHQIIEVFPQFLSIHSNFKLKVVGETYKESAYQDWIMSLIKKYKLENKIEFMGNRTDVYSIMAHATALIVPSRFEGFGFITTEAMLNDCLVIGKNTAGTKEQMDNGYKAYGEEIALRFVSNNDLLNCMNEAVEKDTVHMRTIAKKFVMEKYTCEKCARQIDDFYHEILNNRSCVI